jgi:hypothetical protein
VANPDPGLAAVCATKDPRRTVFAQNGAFSHIQIAHDFLSLPNTLTRRAITPKDTIMKNSHSNLHNTEIRPTWYLALLVWPALTALMFIVAGSGVDQPSNLAQGQPGLSATATTVASYANVGETTAP